MARPEDLVAAVQLTIETGLDPPGIRAATARAAKAGRTLDTVVEAIEQQADASYFVVKTPGLLPVLGARYDAAFRVSWQQEPHSCWRVRVIVDEYRTSQATVFGVAARSRSIPALASLRRFAEALKIELLSSPPPRL